MTITIPIPANSQEFEESISDETVLSKLFAEKNFGEYVSAYTDKMMKANNEELHRQAIESAAAGLAQFLRTNGDDVKRVDFADKAYQPRRPASRAERRRAPNPRANGTPLNGVFLDMADYAQIVYAISPSTVGQPTKDMAEKIGKLRAYTELVPAEGGFLLPEEFRAELFSLALEIAIVSPNALVVPMSTPSIRFPTVDETTRVGSVFGGVTVTRVPPGGAITASSAAFGSVKLEVTKQVAAASLENEMFNGDVAASLLAWIENSMPAAMVDAADRDYISGDGVGGPLGGLHTDNPALIKVAGESTQTANTIVWPNIVKMYARMLPTSLGSAMWVASPDTFAELATMALEVGTGGSAVWIVNGVGEPTLMLLGRPVRMTEKAPAALGTQGDLSFVDWGHYLIGDRQQVTVDASPHVEFMNDRTVLRCIARNDGRPWLQAPLTPANNSATLSPFVTLQTRA